MDFTEVSLCRGYKFCLFIIIIVYFTFYFFLFNIAFSLLSCFENGLNVSHVREMVPEWGLPSKLMGLILSAFRSIFRHTVPDTQQKTKSRQNKVDGRN